MKKLIYIFLGLLFLGNLNAQTPINELNLLSLSSGRYNEMHEYSRYERVGSAIIDMETMKIVSFISKDSLQKIAGLDQGITTRFLSVDPMARKYPEMNPYGYCANNPINAIDPDGREIRYIIRDANNPEKISKTYRYTKGNFYDISTNKMYDPDNGSYSTLNRLTKSYQAIENSIDNFLKGRLHHLESSKKFHYIEKGRGNYVYTRGGGHTQTTYNFDQNTKEDYIDIGKSDLGSVSHEMQHQYDWDIDNMKDNAPGASATDPAEIRAVATENKARDLEAKEHRTTYGGVKIDPEKLENPPNYKQ